MPSSHSEISTYSHFRRLLSVLQHKSPVQGRLNVWPQHAEPVGVLQGGSRARDQQRQACSMAIKKHVLGISYHLFPSTPNQEIKARRCPRTPELGHAPFIQSLQLKWEGEGVNELSRLSHSSSLEPPAWPSMVERETLDIKIGVLNWMNF